MSVYVAVIIGYLTVLFYMIDMKVAIGKLEVKVDHLEKK
jgi:hypothetical protein